MLMVIFGAGASYDSDYRRNPALVDQVARLPLAKDLFLNAYGSTPPGIQAASPCSHGFVTRQRSNQNWKRFGTSRKRIVT